MNLKQHLKLTKDFLGFKGNSDVNRLLDLGLSEKFQPQYHKLSHNPKFIREFIFQIYGEKGELEAWLHLLADFGFFNDYYSKNDKHKK